MVDRKRKMNTWLKALGYDETSLQTASEDASFRRYFRIKKDGQSYIVMDAPPQHESCESFVNLATLLTQHHVNAPIIFEKNLAEGFLVLSDFGDNLLLGLLNKATVNPLYTDAMSAILTMQQNMPLTNIPVYSEQLLDTEMELFIEWFVGKLLTLSLNDDQQKIWAHAKACLIKNAIEQPQTFVHRDFHSRNLIKEKTGEIGIIDFQDAVKGPMTYDLVSLLRDCYVAWPEQNIEQWLTDFYQQAVQKGLLDATFSQFKTWFNLMGVQRHLKAIGIFSRLKLRDGKQGYIADIPRTLQYIVTVCQTEGSLSGLKHFIDELSLVEKAKVFVEC